MNADNAPALSAHLNALTQHDPRCIFLRDSFTRRDLASLVSSADCYVSPHRSEGFGLTVAEAMILGKPVIATDYGGSADFLTKEVGFPLHYRLIEIEQDHGPYTKGAIWADPSREHLEQLMRWVVEHPTEIKAIGQRAHARMLKDYSAWAIGQHVAKRLDIIGSSSQI